MYIIKILNPNHQILPDYRKSIDYNIPNPKHNHISNVPQVPESSDQKKRIRLVIFLIKVLNCRALNYLILL